MAGVELGFVPQPLMVPVDKIMPSRKVPTGVVVARRFKRIQASIEEIGVIEPLTVVPMNGGAGQYMLLDGHIRLIILCEMGCTEVACLERERLDRDREASHDLNRLLDKPGSKRIVYWVLPLGKHMPLMCGRWGRWAACEQHWPV